MVSARGDRRGARRIRGIRPRGRARITACPALPRLHPMAAKPGPIDSGSVLAPGVVGFLLALTLADRLPALLHRTDRRLLRSTPMSSQCRDFSRDGGGSAAAA